MKMKFSPGRCCCNNCPNMFAYVDFSGATAFNRCPILGHPFLCYTGNLIPVLFEPTRVGGIHVLKPKFYGTPATGVNDRCDFISSSICCPMLKGTAKGTYSVEYNPPIGIEFFQACTHLRVDLLPNPEFPNKLLISLSWVLQPADNLATCTFDSWPFPGSPVCEEIEWIAETDVDWFADWPLCRFDIDALVRSGPYPLHASPGSQSNLNTLIGSGGVAQVCFVDVGGLHLGLNCCDPLELPNCFGEEPPSPRPRARTYGKSLLATCRTQEPLRTSFNEPLRTSFNHGEARENSLAKCIHQLEQIDTRTCYGCSSSQTEVPVFSCFLHGKCSNRPVITERRTIDPEIRSCASCPDYET